MKMRIYKCEKKFFLDEYDEKGSWTELQLAIEEGSIWHVDEDSTYNDIASKDAIRLVNDKCSWMELSPDTIEHYFTKVEVPRI